MRERHSHDLGAMKQFILWAAALLMPASCVIAQSAQNDASLVGLTFVEQLEQQTVALVYYVDDDGDQVDAGDPTGELKAYCTGVWVSSNTILTAEHCVDDIGRPEPAVNDVLRSLGLQENEQDDWTPIGQPVMYSERDDISTDVKRQRSASVVAVDMYNDLALLKADAPGKHLVAHLSCDEIHDGDELHMTGHTVGMWWSYKHGYVSAHRTKFPTFTHHMVNMLQVSAPVYLGDSGGGAFNSRGELVGIADAVEKNVPDMAWYVHRDVLRSFLEHERVIPTRR